MSDTFYFDQGDGVIEAPGEIDMYPVELVAGTSYTLAVGGASSGLGTLADPAVILFDEYGTVLGHQDDSQLAGLDPHSEFVAPYSGVYYVGVTDLTGGVGSYTPALVETSGAWW